jgi:hypothetical protein
MIGTHLYTFLLVPASMFVFYDKIDDLKADRCRSPFVVLLGLSFTMVSPAAAIAASATCYQHY